VESVSWQSIFFLNLPVAVGAVVVTLFAVRESRDESVGQRVDVRGVLTLTTGLAALVLALVEGNQWHWGSTRELALFALAAVSLGAFGAVERHQSSPMVDFSFFRARTFLGANIVAFIVSFAMLAMFFFMALYMQNVLHYSPLQAGIRFLPSTLMIVMIAPLAGRLTDRVGPRPLIAFGLTAVSGALFWQSHLSLASGYGALLPGFVLMGIGMAFVMSPMSTAAMNAVAQAKAGVASGILSMNRMVGGTFGVAVLGAMVSTLGSSRIHQLVPTMSAGARAHLTASLGSGELPQGVSTQVADAGQSAFVYALHYGLLMSSAVALIGAVLAWTLIDRKAPASELAAADLRASKDPSAGHYTPSGVLGAEAEQARTAAAETVPA